jgi:uncharacterized membrane protein YccC
MGRIILIVLGVLFAFMIISWLISALHFLFWIAVITVVIVGALKLTGSARRWSRQ